MCQNNNKEELFNNYRCSLIDLVVVGTNHISVVIQFNNNILFIFDKKTQKIYIS